MFFPKYNPKIKKNKENGDALWVIAFDAKLYNPRGALQ